MAHEADKWIADNWMDRQVRQYTGSPDCIGRTGKVVETTWDEKGALHCRTDAGWWCPAAKLELMK